MLKEITEFFHSFWIASVLTVSILAVVLFLGWMTNRRQLVLDVGIPLFGVVIIACNIKVWELLLKYALTKHR